MEKNITVTDETGKVLGFTYPKRAKGLIKNGRALYVDDCTIRLSGVSPDLLSEAKQMNYILLNPRDWSEKDGVERSFIDGFEGKLEEILQIGSWNGRYEAESRHFLLDANTEYASTFEQLNERCEELSVSDGKSPEISQITSMLESVKCELAKVNISDLEAKLASIFSASDANLLEGMLSTAEGILDKSDAMLDSVENLLDDLEEDLDEIEDEMDED